MYKPFFIRAAGNLRSWLQDNRPSRGPVQAVALLDTLALFANVNGARGSSQIDFYSARVPTATLGEQPCRAKDNGRALLLMPENVSLIYHSNEGDRSMILRAPLMMKALFARFGFFLSVWLMIAGWRQEDLPVGLVAAALALWISLSVLPPTVIRPRLAPLAKLNLRFLSCSIIAGVDVARRALLPQLDLRPGFVDVPLTLPPGTARSTFLAYQSLQPGTSPTSAEGEVLHVHCLDISQPVAAAIVTDEDLFKKAIGHE